ncbi:hypothetical protein ACJVC5_03220 [Peredibacter sp. HCB2-198]|uniref:hypothetical protein n=1 Tax=Peredibacter sp. HCB2-198 TaxID=3383025 RepID=UPI0038B496B2
MKRMIAVAGLLVVSAASAQELKFGDVNFFLKEHQQNLTLDIFQTYYKSENKANQTTETRGNLFSATYAYAFSNSINAFLGLDYIINNQTEDRTNTDASLNQNSFYSNGLANPAVGLNYRLLNQNSSRYNVDFGFIAKINVQDAEKGSLGPGPKNGNYANGRNSYELNARTGRKWNEANEWQLAAGFIYNQEGDYKQRSAGGDTTIDEDSSQDIYLRATYQYRPVNEFMTLISAQATRVGEIDKDIQADDHVDLDFRFIAKYLITESFIAKFHYGMSRNSDYDTLDGAGEEVKRRENFFGLGADFLF